MHKMQNDPDYHMALLLQQQFNSEFSVENPAQDLTYNTKKKILNTGKSLIDPSWEVVDPTPNIFELFVQFNDRFFWKKLGSVAVSWSKRMTTCAGVCSYQGRGGLCHITLSEPLLKLRPRKDLIETLLHEMIHALLFVTNNNRDRDGHGPEFHKHMYRINHEAGTNITVYHDFHDEVRLYQQHWWRCDGPCQKRPPYFGMVRRAMNRAPGRYDRWWAQHQQTCGGNFIKVKEPEKNNKKPNKASINTSSNKSIKNKSPKKNSPTTDNLPDIRNYLPVMNDISNKSNIQTINTVKSAGGLGIKNKNSTIVLNPKNSGIGNNLSVSSVIPTSSNIVGFSKDINKIPVRNNIEVFSGAGKKLNGSSVPNNSIIPDYNAVRNHWANKFSSSENCNDSNIKRKKLKFESEVNTVKNKVPNIIPTDTCCPNCSQIFAETEINSHLDTCLNADDSIKSEFSNESLTMVECPACKTIMEEDTLNDHLDQCLMSDDKRHCELCNTYISSEEFTLHVNDCLNKCYDNIEQDLNIKTTTTSGTVLCLVCNKNIIKDSLNDHLEDCMGTVFDQDNFNDDNDNDNDPLNKTIYNCPICMANIDESNMNSHIDECLNTAAIKNEFS